MKNNRKMLADVLKTVQLGQVGIRSVMDKSMRPGLRMALESQLRELDAIESEAHIIACQRGWELQELDPALRFFSDRRIRMKLTHGNSDSKIADIMIRRATTGMITGLKNLHQYPRQDDRISSITQKLIDSQTANIRQMQSFL